MVTATAESLFEYLFDLIARSVVQISRCRYNECPTAPDLFDILRLACGQTFVLWPQASDSIL